MSRTKSRLGLIILVIILAVIAGGIVYLWPRLEGQAPEIALEKELTHIGKSQPVFIRVSDPGQGLAWVRVTLVQKEKQGLVLNQDFDLPAPPLASLKLAVKPLEYGMRQGPAVLVVEAGDRSLRGWLSGNVSKKEFQVEIDTTPPRLSNLSQIIRVNRGGAGVAVYMVNEEKAAHGVRVGDKVFMGVSPWPQRPKTKLCYFAYGEDQPRDLNIDLWARDAAGNASMIPLNVKVRWKKFRTDTISLNQKLMTRLVNRFAGIIPTDRQTLLDKFLWINQDLRKANNGKIMKLANQGEPFQLWDKAFSRPLGAPRAGFGDRRVYTLDGKTVSHSVHLGQDLAHTERSPIKAVANGIVRFTGPIGIYGNTVILTHGQGIASIYGHLSQIAVQVGNEVKRGQMIGRSGATGLALGDHLHISMLVQGMFVNPNEWWDSHWIKDNIWLRFDEAGLPKPLPPTQAGSGS